jgi:Domain of unknown function (DUF397)
MTMRRTSPEWRRSPHCASSACVEVAKVADRFLIRDSKNPDAGTLEFTTEEWKAFIEAVKRDEFRFE